MFVYPIICIEQGPKLRPILTAASSLPSVEDGTIDQNIVRNCNIVQAAIIV